MIPSLIILTMRYLRKLDPEELTRLRSMIFSLLRKIVLLFLLLVLIKYAHGQDKELEYKISRKGVAIGTMNFKETKLGENVKYRMHSKIFTRFILEFSAIGTEEAEYENGILKNSRFLQLVNGNEKANYNTWLKGNHYLVQKKGSINKLPHGTIGYNLVCLYSNEPLERKEIYSDKFQLFLPIKKLKEHHYRISFPDGNYNEYLYENGLCKKIKVENKLFSVVMELKN
jgi:hypothetical protein